MRGEDPSHLISEEQSTGSPTIKGEVQGIQQRPPRWLGLVHLFFVKRCRVCWAWFSLEKRQERNNSLLLPTEVVQALHNDVGYKEGIN